MVIYVVVFLITIFCTAIAEKVEQNKLLFLIFSAIAVLVPAAVAGCRDLGIGTDTITYADHIFRLMVNRHYSFMQFLSSYKDEDFVGAEFIYLLINYIVSLFTDSVNWFYFVANLIVILFFYRAAYDNRKKGSMWLAMLFFLCLFYNLSLNIMRQSIAIGMTIYAYKYIENKDWKRALIWLVIIFNAHSSGIFFVMLFFVRWVAYLKNYKLAIRLQVSFALAISFLFIYFNSLLSLLAIVSDRFSKYEELYSDEQKKQTMVGLTTFFVLILVLLFFVKKALGIKRNRDMGLYIYNQILGIAFMTTSAISITVGRISWYLNVLDCIYVPRALRELSYRKKGYAQLLTVATVILLIAIWYLGIIVSKWHDTYPYKSKILGLY